MAIASIPTNLAVSTANAQNYLTWDITSGALSYSVQRSTDGVTFTPLATPSLNNYLDASVTIGTTYFYQVASVNASGTSGYATSSAVVPVGAGEMSLGTIRLAAQQRADMVNSQFLSNTEWNANINSSLFELYDLLVTLYDDYFIAPALTISADGVNSLFPLPNGVLYSAAPPMYKLRGVDLAVNAAANSYVTVPRFNFAERNQWLYQSSNSTPYGAVNLRYRLMGNQIELLPIPGANQSIRLWYIPRLTMLLKDSDVTTAGVSGWIEYVVIDAAIKALQKEESDVSVLMSQKQALVARINGSAQNRDAGQPETISDSRNRSGGPHDGWSNSGWGM